MTLPESGNSTVHYATGHTDRLITDFTEPIFAAAFQCYFAELGIEVPDWGRLFRQMNDEGSNTALLRTAADGRDIGFIQFQPIEFTSWFFRETCGFIREFWVAEDVRGGGHGAALLGLAEAHFARQGIHTSILTTDTAPDFYRKRGYIQAPGCEARNGDAVFVKRLD
ncbi:GNAT family N-acetyltransferase [Actinobaculum sp. 352]|uniref:GNAT family N-acetyltransferase n=1 Tax=Actinobaculum sp. 352 TaxID=2490946 RepID=UPI000F7EF732|nr:GNAT family N-acetyltransferase [Actinobaculum sp. 352]RTE50657.1 GNAT family N-acetyltransferase [Actinobaculum sp. 352]